MTAYIAPYIPFAMVSPQTGMPTPSFQAFWKTSLESVEAAAVAAAAAQTAADAANANADTRQPASVSLSALSALAGTGLVEQTGTGAFTNRPIGVGSAISIPTRANADGRYVQRDQAAAPSYPATTISNPPTQAEVQAISTALTALIAALQSVHALT
jgi:hypothetical protein